MTITTRSKRVSEFGTGTHTPAAVGPGSYASESLGASFKDTSRPLFSGFATSEKRNLNANRTTSAITPGPGAYIDDGFQNNPKAPSNVFVTKTARFAPSAPGSTIFLPSSVQDNPGPGSYLRSSVSTSAPSSNQLQEVDGRTINKFAHFVKPSVPAIPKKEQSYGYLQVGSELKPQQQPPTIYSGVGQDTVGPAAYNVHHEIWNEKKNVASSLRSTVKREVWEANAQRASVPGPGHYYEEPALNDATSTGKGGGLRGRKKSVKHERQSAVFASKVPILPDPKPATQYDPERDLELNAKEARLRYQLERQKTNVMKAKIEAFGSTTGRVELTSQLSAPFSNPTYTLTPGPGMYSDRTRSLRGQKKHRTPSGPSSSSGGHRRDDSMGFSSATERDCLSKPKKPAAPGPGAYRNETPRSLHHTVKSKLGIGRNGVFGTTSERRVWEQLERLEDDELTPGPGAYEKPVETHAGHFPLAANSAAFKSSSHRFTKRSNPHATPHVHCVGDHVAPAVGQYDIPQSLVLGSDTGNGIPGSPPVSARGATAGAGFLSKSERAVFDTKDARDLPGPGAYTEGAPKSALHTRLNEVRSSIGNEERFRVKPTVPENVGPGAYSIPGTVGFKSFNVTMTPATPQQEQYRAALSPRLQLGAMPSR